VAGIREEPPGMQQQLEESRWDSLISAVGGGNLALGTKQLKEDGVDSVRWCC
jgi:hypothetical protein